jgi:CRP-like cAMP-binding protein
MTALLDRLSVAAGELLFRQGDPADAAVLVRSGCIELALHAPGRGDPVHVERSEVGDLFGEPALLAAATRGRTARVVEEGRVGWLERSDLQSLLASFHPASLRIVRTIAQHMALRLSSPASSRASSSTGWWCVAPTTGCGGGIDRRRGATASS